MAGGFDEFLSWAIPALLIIITAGFLYVKVIKPLLVPHIITFWNWLTKKNEESQEASVQKVITYD